MGFQVNDVTLLSGDTQISGSMIVLGDNWLGGTTTVKQDLLVSGQTYIEGETVIMDELFVGDVDSPANMEVYGNTTIKGTLTVGEPSGVTQFDMYGNIYVYDELTVEAQTYFTQGVVEIQAASQLHVLAGSSIVVGNSSIDGVEITSGGINYNGIPIVTMGTSGTSGENGSSGTSGVGISGSSGTSGENGSSGTAGGTGLPAVIPEESGTITYPEVGQTMTTTQNNYANFITWDQYVTIYSTTMDVWAHGFVISSSGGGTSMGVRIDEVHNPQTGVTNNYVTHGWIFGTDGLNGSSGTSGGSGSSGTSGNAGTSGTSGDSGSTFTGLTFSSETLTVPNILFTGQVSGGTYYNKNGVELTPGAPITEINDGLYYGNGVGGASITTATGNFIFGDENMTGLTTGNDNIAFGRYNYRGNKTGSDNILIGSYILDTAGASYSAMSGNILIGKNVGQSAAYNGTADRNVIIGQDAASQRNLTGNENVVLGYLSAQHLKEGASNNVILGAQAAMLGGYNNVGNIVIGHSAARNCNNTNTNNIVLGTNAGSVWMYYGAHASEIYVDAYGTARATYADELANGIIQGKSALVSDDQYLNFQSAVNIKHGLTVSGHTVTPSYELNITVSPYSNNFKTLVDTINWLSVNMSGNTTVLLTADEEVIDNTITVNLPYNLAIKGGAYDQNILKPGAGLGNSPMFVLQSNTSFTKVVFDTTGTSFGSNVDEDCIQVATDGLYIEVKDFLINGFYRGIYSTSNSEFWIMEGGINNCVKAGFELNTTSDGAIMRTTLNDWSCSENLNYIGINLLSGSTIYISSQNDTSKLTHSGQTFINYVGNSITYTDFTIIGCIWNNVGTFRTGFDFTLKRDADIVLLNNSGDENMLPHAKFVSQTNLSGITLTTTNQAIPWTPYSTYAKKFSFNNGVVTYLPTHKKSVVMWISGAITASNQPATVTLSIVKNGNFTGTTFGNMSVYIDQNSRAFNFSTNVYLDDVLENETFVIAGRCSTGTEAVILQDLNWLILSQ